MWQGGSCHGVIALRRNSPASLSYLALRGWDYMPSELLLGAVQARPLSATLATEALRSLFPHC